MVPFGDNRYFTAGADNALMQNTELYEVDNYDLMFGMIAQSYPNTICINLREEMDQFLASAPPVFDIKIEEIIELACFYYCDWDSVVAVTDEFLQAQTIEDLRQELAKHIADENALQERVNDTIAVLSQALQRFIGVVIGVLTRANAPAIVDYGCCYRLESIWDNGTVFFQLCNPARVRANLEDDRITL